MWEDNGTLARIASPIFDTSVPKWMTPQLVMMPPVRTSATCNPPSEPRCRCSSMGGLIFADGGYDRGTKTE